MQIDADVDLGCVAPEVIPDVVGKDVGSAAAELGGYTGEDPVYVCERTGRGGSEVVALVHVDAHGVDGRYADNYTC